MEKYLFNSATIPFVAEGSYLYRKRGGWVGGELAGSLIVVPI